MEVDDLRSFLDRKVAVYNNPNFIKDDPISIPHGFRKQQDQEIMGLFAATLAWGQRVTIINNCNKLAESMDHAPYDFIRHHQETDLKKLLGFVHRTFNDTDLLYFIAFLKHHYTYHSSLEQAFTQSSAKGINTIEQVLIHFQNYFFSLESAPQRTRKHVATPARNSACKRLNMFLRWMVRSDDAGVDFGLWKTIKPSQLICPLDVHVSRVARQLGLLQRKQDDWKAAVELTDQLKQFDAEDPVKYDFALFGIGVMEK